MHDTVIGLFGNRYEFGASVYIITDYQQFENKSKRLVVMLAKSKRGKKLTKPAAKSS